MEEEYTELTGKEVEELWLSIAAYSNSQKRQRRMRVIKNALKYEAAFLLIITVLFLVNRQTSPSHQEFSFSDSNVSMKSEEARLHLYTGQEVPLERSQSSVQVISDEEIHINNERIIKVKEVPEKRKHNGTDQMNEIIVPYGKTSKLALPDGSMVWLNAGTRLAFPSRFSTKERTVYLEGEAYFEIAHNPDKTFRVKAGNVYINVFGTKYNVSAYPNDEFVQAFLLEGEISVTKGSARSSRDKLFVEPNQVAVYSLINKDFHILPVYDKNEYIAWKEGWFKFHKENLQSVIRKLERYYNVDFVMDDSGTLSGVFTGKLDVSASLEQVINVLSDVTEIDFILDDKRVFIDLK